MHRDATAVPPMEIGGGHDDRPLAIGAKDSLSMGSASIRLIIHRHHCIVVLVEERHLVIVGHGLSWLNVLYFFDDEAVT